MTRVRKLEWIETNKGRFKAFPFGGDGSGINASDHFMVVSYHPGQWNAYGFQMNGADWSHIPKDEEGRCIPFATGEEAMEALQKIWESYILTRIEGDET